MYDFHCICWNNIKWQTHGFITLYYRVNFRNIVLKGEYLRIIEATTFQHIYKNFFQFRSKGSASEPNETSEKSACCSFGYQAEENKWYFGDYFMELSAYNPLQLRYLCDSAYTPSVRYSDRNLLKLIWNSEHNRKVKQRLSHNRENSEFIQGLWKNKTFWNAFCSVIVYLVVRGLLT